MGASHELGYDPGFLQFGLCPHILKSNDVVASDSEAISKARSRIEKIG
jgi:hypothetical protein